jgi:RNA polymerase sigma factor (sigma-70 family)
MALLEIDAECVVANSTATRRRSSRSREKAEHAIEAALQSLTPDQRDALFLHLGKGMTCLEIAQQTGVPREAVLNDLLRAYARMRKLMDNDEP